jgi:hypothetical protein
LVGIIVLGDTSGGKSYGIAMKFFAVGSTIATTVERSSFGKTKLDGLVVVTCLLLLLLFGGGGIGRCRFGCFAGDFGFDADFVGSFGDGSCCIFRMVDDDDCCCCRGDAVVVVVVVVIVDGESLVGCCCNVVTEVIVIVAVHTPSLSDNVFLFYMRSSFFISMA